VKSGAYFVVTGLKKTFSLQTFTDLLQNVGLKVITLENTDVLKGYVALTIKSDN
jgi:hypothetical protein